MVNPFLDRGIKIERTYQLNKGGNTDFLNILEHGRSANKKTSKTKSVASMVEAGGQHIDEENIHVRPSDYAPQQKDKKICFLRIEREHFGDVPIHMEMHLSVEGSPKSAGVAIN